MKKYSTPVVDVFVQSSEVIMADVISSSGSIPVISWEEFKGLSNESGL